MAEVLITLGIIGVVAALTIPTLITNYQKQQTVVQLRKVYSDLSNAIKLSEVDNGPMSGWDYPVNSNFENVAPFVNKYYLPYLQNAKLVKSEELNSQGYVMLKGPGNRDLLLQDYIILNNGVILAFQPGIVHDYLWLLADINGMKGPNRVGRDVFVFDAYKYASSKYKLSFWNTANGNVDSDTLNNLKQSGRYACNSENTDQFANFNCARVIELSGWKIPSDYPW